MKSLVMLLCAALTVAGCSDSPTQRGANSDDPGTPRIENNGQDPSNGGGSTSGDGTGDGETGGTATDGLRREGDTVVRESDGFVFDPNDVNHYRDDTNNPYPETSRQFTCAYAAITDHFGVLYISSKQCTPESRAEQCDLIPQDVSIPHCTFTGTVVSSIKGLPSVGTTFEFVDTYNERTFAPQVDDIIFASFFNIRGVAIAEAVSFVAPLVEYQDLYSGRYPTASMSLPKSLDEQANMILDSDCVRATKQHVERIEEYYFGRSEECAE